jgi:pantothenate kinase
MKLFHSLKKQDINNRDSGINKCCNQDNLADIFVINDSADYKQVKAKLDNSKKIIDIQVIQIKRIQIRTNRFRGKRCKKKRREQFYEWVFIITVHIQAYKKSQGDNIKIWG